MAVMSGAVILGQMSSMASIRSTDARRAAGSFSTRCTAVRTQAVGSRNEQGAAYMAFGHARSTGRPGVTPSCGSRRTEHDRGIIPHTRRTRRCCAYGQIPSARSGAASFARIAGPACNTAIRRAGLNASCVPRRTRRRQRSVHADRQRPSRSCLDRDADGHDGAAGRRLVARPRAHAGRTEVDTDRITDAQSAVEGRAPDDRDRRRWPTPAERSSSRRCCRRRSSRFATGAA